ncbi:MAG: hypothetical protein ACRCYQ_10720 [Nocardioides sp.]
MPPLWTDSTGKHGVSRADAVHAMLHATYTDVLAGEEGARPAGQVRLFIGPRHPQALADDEVEVLVHEFPDTGDQAVIFHVMPLGPKFRTYREEHS